MGNCTRDPEVKYTPKGTAVAELGLAVNRVYSTDQGEKREETTFVDIELWGRQAEIAGEYLKKGRPVYIEGRLKLDQWDDKQTGQKRYKMRVVCENLQLLGSKPTSGGEEPSGEYTETRTNKPPATKPQAPPRPPPDPDLDPYDSDDIPL